MNRNEGGRSWLGIIIRFVVAAVVLMVTALLTPGFSNIGFGTALLAAIVIAAMDYVIQKLFKIDASPFGRGIVGFLLSALIIYLTQFLVPGMRINVFGAIVAALIIGIIDAIIPTHVM
ncbi:phage holin family protein [Caldicoprobacter guelmensis]|uniref:phage holin family protein n=1 Tax=Caldicoprobacter guelmensis TaxID=1170224 RepID=UPI001FAF6589|nr:phage holin family protein [Caldicoprobacter guelmensis]